MQRPELRASKKKKAASFAWELGFELHCPAARLLGGGSHDSGRGRRNGHARLDWAGLASSVSAQSREESATGRRIVALHACRMQIAVSAWFFFFFWLSTSRAGENDNSAFVLYAPSVRAVCMLFTGERQLMAFVANGILDHDHGFCQFKRTEQWTLHSLIQQTAMLY